MGYKYPSLRTTLPIAGYYARLDAGSAATDQFTADETNDGTLNNGATRTNDSGLAYLFDGVDDYWRITRRSAYSTLLSSQKTVAAWVKTSSPGSSYRTLWSQDRCFAFTLKSGVFITYDWAAATDRSSGVNVADGTWKHLAITFDPGVTNGSKFWINGSQAGSAFTYSSQVGSSGMDMSVGTALTTAPLNAPASEYCNCLMDDLLLYQTILSAADIGYLASQRGAIYQQVANGGPINSQSLVRPAGDYRPQSLVVM